MVGTALTLILLAIGEKCDHGNSTITSIKISETHSKGILFSCWVSSVRQVLRRQDGCRAGMRGAEDVDSWSSTFAIVCQNGCHFGHLQVYKWKPEAVARAQGHELVIKGCFSLFRSKTKSEERQQGTVARNYWMNDPNTLADSQNFTSLQCNEWNCFASLWGMISVARPLAKPQQLPHGCLLCGLSPDAEKPAVSVYRKCICSEPQSQDSKSRRQEDFQQCAACPSAMWPNFGSWLGSLEFQNGPYPGDILRA